MRTLVLSITIASLVTVVSLGCDAMNPSRPSNLSPAGLGEGFAVSGVVTEHRGAPLAAATVRSRPNSPPGYGSKSTLTSADGSYRIERLTEPTILDVTKDGYEPVSLGAYSGDSVANVTMHRRLWIAAGGRVNAKIWGDDAVPIDDIPECHQPPFACVAIHVVAPSSGRLTADLSWNSTGSQLGVRILTDFVIWTWHWEGPGAHGSSPLQVSADVHYGDTFVIVSFDKLNGAHPPPNAGQAFELATSFQ
jgi:hypothetical protein